MEESVNRIMKLKSSAFEDLTSASTELTIANEAVTSSQKRKRSVIEELSKATAALVSAEDVARRAQERKKAAKQVLDMFKLNENTDALKELFAAARKCSDKPPVQQLN